MFYGYYRFVLFALDQTNCNSLLFQPVNCDTIEQVHYHSKPGFGGQKEVSKVFWGCQRVVVKKAKNNVDPDLVAGTRAQAFALEHLFHPNLARMLGKCDTGTAITTVEEFIEGDLLNFLENDYPLESALLFAVSIVRLANYFVNSPLGVLMHCDFVPHNFIVSPNLDYITLIDVDTIWSMDRNNMFKYPEIPRSLDHTSEGEILHRNHINTGPKTCYSDSDCFMYCSNHAPETSICDTENKKCVPFDIRAFTYTICYDLLIPLLHPHLDDLPYFYQDMIESCVMIDPNDRLSMGDLLTSISLLYQQTMQRHPPAERKWGLLWTRGLI